jgi:hypothetical protein
MMARRSESHSRYDGRATAWFAALLLLAVPSIGCHVWSQDGDIGKSPLRPATPSSDSVTLEIWTVRSPSGDIALNDSVWNEVDEQKIPTALRRELKRNGLRAGVLGTSIPGAIARRFEIDDEAPTDDDVWQAIDPHSTPTISRRIKQVRDEGEFEIAPSVTVHGELHLVSRDEGKAQSRTYHNAQAAFRATAQLNGDGHVRLHFTPELHFGNSHQMISLESGGTPRYDTSRPKEVFGKLTTRFVVAPGEMLLLGCVPNRPGSIGHYLFHEESPDGPQQRLLLVRLARAPPGELFEDDEP